MVGEEAGALVSQTLPRPKKKSQKKKGKKKQKLKMLGSSKLFELFAQPSYTSKLETIHSWFLLGYNNGGLNIKTKTYTSSVTLVVTRKWCAVTCTH
jgi:hypothetical protein